MEEEQINIVANNLITAYIAQMDSALKISEILAKHNNDKDIEADEIVGGLIYRLMVPMDDTEIKDSIDNATQIMNTELSSEEESEEEFEEESNQLDNNTISNTLNNEKPRKIKVNTCDCAICSKVRECIISYENYTPIDELADRFKNSIKVTCNKHNLII